MAKSKSHSKHNNSKSHVVQKGAQQGLAPQKKPVTAKAPVATSAVATASQQTPTAPSTPAKAKTPEFSAANSSLQKATQQQVNETQATVEQPATLQATPASSIVELELAPEFASKLKEERNAATVAAPKPPRQPTTAVKPATAATQQTKPVAQPIPTKPVAQPTLPTQVAREANRPLSAALPQQRTWRSRPSVWIGGSVGALLLIVGGAAAGAYSKFASGGTIAPGVSIAGVPVGGLTPEMATQRVRDHFGRPQITLLCDGENVQLPISALGAKLSIEPTVRKAFNVGRDGFLPNNLMRVYGNSGDGKNFMLPIEWNKAQLVKGLHQTNSKIARKPVDARLRAGVAGLEVVPDQQGRELNVGAAAHLLQRKFYVGMPSLHVPARRVGAQIKADELNGQDIQLAQYTTHFNPGLPGRCANLRVACRAIQNHVLMPGDVFSFNACTGERTANKGYRMAHIFERKPGAAESEVVDGLAGGVCQVSSTLFNAVRKTNQAADINPLKIVERTSHSLPVTYVPRGLDATVAWPYKDFKFSNVTNHPVYIRTEMGRSTLSISIWGRIPNA